MSDQPALPPATPATAPTDRSGLLVACCATAIILVALGAGGYLLKQELDRMANAKPEAPPEVTKALSDLRSQLDQQRSDSATQLHALQNELATLKEQQAAQEPPDVNAAIAPVEEKLDALIQQIQEMPPQQTAPAVEAAAAESSPLPAIAVPMGEPLRAYLGLRRKVESGQPYAAELATLIPHVPQDELAAIATLQEHAESGIGLDDEEDDAPASELKPWMQQMNARLKGLVSIKPSMADKMTPQSRAETLAALDRIEASLMGAQ